MTKKEFAKQIFQLIQNGIEEDKSELVITDNLELFLDALKPRNKEKFAKWGHPIVQIHPSKCWI